MSWRSTERIEVRWENVVRDRKQEARPAVREDKDDEPLYYTVAQAAALVGVSKRWLEDQCRDEEIEHVHIARKRKFTPAQLEKLFAKHTVTPAKTEARDSDLKRIASRIQRDQGSKKR